MSTTVALEEDGTGFGFIIFRKWFETSVFHLPPAVVTASVFIIDIPGHTSSQEICRDSVILIVHSSSQSWHFAIMYTFLFIVMITEFLYSTILNHLKAKSRSSSAANSLERSKQANGSLLVIYLERKTKLFQSVICRTQWMYEVEQWVQSHRFKSFLIIIWKISIQGKIFLPNSRKSKGHVTLYVSISDSFLMKNRMVLTFLP